MPEEQAQPVRTDYNTQPAQPYSQPQQETAPQAPAYPEPEASYGQEERNDSAAYVQQPSEERNAADYNFQELKKDFNSCQSENQRLKAENEQLLQKCSILQKEVDTLKKRLDRKEIALLKKL